MDQPIYHIDKFNIYVVFLKTYYILSKSLYMYQNKYIKYKAKYLKLVEIIGGDDVSTAMQFIKINGMMLKTLSPSIKKIN